MCLLCSQYISTAKEYNLRKNPNILESMTKIRWAQIDLVLSWKQLLTRLLFTLSDQYTLSSDVWINIHLWSQFLSNRYDKNEGSTSMTNKCLDCRVCMNLSVPVSVSLGNIDPFL